MSAAASNGCAINPPVTMSSGCARYVKVVATPKLPPPPRSAQNRSGAESSVTSSTSPSAVTSSTASRLSAARPCFAISQPRPPPSVSPATPVWEIAPPVVARPCSAASRFSSAARPASLWPPPRTEISSPSRRAKWTVSTMSAVFRHCAISAGRRSIIALWTRRASSYPASEGSRMVPVNAARSSSSRALSTVAMVCSPWWRCDRLYSSVQPCSSNGSDRAAGGAEAAQGSLPRRARGRADHASCRRRTRRGEHRLQGRDRPRPRRGRPPPRDRRLRGFRLLRRHAARGARGLRRRHPPLGGDVHGARRHRQRPRRRRPGLPRHARSRPRGGRRFHRHPAPLRPRVGRVAGRARQAARAHGAVLRRRPDARRRRSPRVLLLDHVSHQDRVDELAATAVVLLAVALALEAEGVVQRDRVLVPREHVQLELANPGLACAVEGGPQERCPYSLTPRGGRDHQADVGDVGARGVRVAPDGEAGADPLVVAPPAGGGRR